MQYGVVMGNSFRLKAKYDSSVQGTPFLIMNFISGENKIGVRLPEFEVQSYQVIDDGVVDGGGKDLSTCA